MATNYKALPIPVFDAKGKNSSLVLLFSFNLIPHANKFLAAPCYMFQLFEYKFAPKELPDEILEKIFGFITRSSDLESISLTSKEFLRISNRSRLAAKASSVSSLTHIVSRFQQLEHIELNLASGLNSAISTIANSSLPFLTSLTLRGVRFLPHAEIRQLGASSPRLRSLDFSHFEALTDEDVAVVTESFPFLKHLNLGNTRPCHQAFTDSAVQSIAQNCKDLVRLDISKNGNVSDISMESLSTGCEGLISLSVSYCSAITPIGLARIASRCQRLQEFQVAGVTSINCSAKLIENLMASNTLEALDFSQMSISSAMYEVLGTSRIPFKKLAVTGWQSESAASIVKLLKMQCCSQLTHLQIRETLMYDTDFLLVLNNLPNLEFISLSCCTYLTDLSFFGVMLMCRNIVAIEMEHTRIGSRCVKAQQIISDLKSLGSLKSLRIGKNNSLGDTALKDIANICPNLESVDVSHCRLVSNIGIAEIGKKCSKLTDLKIQGCQSVSLLGFEGWPKLFPQLHTLEAGQSGLNDEWVMITAVQCKWLECLRLVRTKVRDAGIEELLKRCKRLKQVTINGRVLPLSRAQLIYFVQKMNVLVV